MASSTRELSPSNVTLLRVGYRVRRDFLVEHNVIPADSTPSRADVRNSVFSLNAGERTALTRRLQRRRSELSDLMDDVPKSFDTPHVTQSDLADEDDWSWRTQ